MKPIDYKTKNKHKCLDQFFKEKEKNKKKEKTESSKITKQDKPFQPKNQPSPEYP